MPDLTCKKCGKIYKREFYYKKHLKEKHGIDVDEVLVDEVLVDKEEVKKENVVGNSIVDKKNIKIKKEIKKIEDVDKVKENSDIKENIKMDLYNEDCLVKMKDIQDKSIDMILCDLPYGCTQNKWDIIIPFDKLWFEYKPINCK